jgi:hypothetical protein
VDFASFPIAIAVEVPHSHWDGSDAVDLFAACGTPWLAVCDGVAQPGEFPLGGHALFLHCSSGGDAYYAHGRADGRASGPVTAGDVVGFVSNSGNANKRGDGQEHDDECHLHTAYGQIDSNGAGTIAPWDVLPGLPPLGGAATAVATQLGSTAQAVADAVTGAPPWLLIGIGAAVLILIRR